MTLNQRHSDSKHQSWVISLVFLMLPWTLVRPMKLSDHEWVIMGVFLWTSVCACISQLCNTCFISTFICNIALRILHMDHTYTIKSFSWYSFKLCTHTKKLSLRISCPGFCNMHPNESYKEIKKTTWGWKDGGISTRQEADFMISEDSFMFMCQLAYISQLQITLMGKYSFLNAYW